MTTCVRIKVKLNALGPGRVATDTPNQISMHTGDLMKLDDTEIYGEGL